MIFSQRIRDGSWIGTRTVFANDVFVVQSSVVVAGAVVTKDVESSTLVRGVTAHVIRCLD